MTDETAALKAEIEVLREQLTDATYAIDGEWGMDDWDGDLDTKWDLPARIAAKLAAPTVTVQAPDGTVSGPFKMQEGTTP